MKTEWSFKKRVVYHETDKMGIVHHSNYIRFMEEARTEYMRAKNVSYVDIEAQGILIPVVDVSCKYKVSATFDDVLEIFTRLSFFNGIKMCFEYYMYFEGTDTLAAVGTSTHCFIREETRKPVSLKKTMPEVYEKVLTYVGK